MTTPNPLAKTKGAGTTFWMYTGKGDAFANPLSDTDWLRLAMVKDLQPGEMTADAEDDTYLDDEDADWKTTTQGQKSVGDTSATLAWRPGDSGQKKLVQLFDSGEVCAFRIKYPNGTVDVFRGWLSSLGKTIASKDVMTRTVKISGVGRPYLAEEGTETVGVKWSISVMETFHWKVRPDMNVVSEPKVVTVKLGDGYEQRRAAGLNNQLSTYSVTIRVRKCEHPSLKAFLERHGGVRAFQWTPPYDWKPIRVVCRKWSASVGALWVTITADFEQVVA
ncbi:phage tail tube protein [Escherichia coli O93:H19]